MARIACIGSRTLTPEQGALCTKLGAAIVAAGHSLHSGNADGADAYFARGGNSVNPGRVYLSLPWKGFNSGYLTPGNMVYDTSLLEAPALEKYREIAVRFHPRYNFLPQGAQKLHLRNGMILIPPSPLVSFGGVRSLKWDGEHVNVVLAWPKAGANKGGTGQGMRIAQGLDIDCLDLSGMTKDNIDGIIRYIQNL